MTIDSESPKATWRRPLFLLGAFLELLGFAWVNGAGILKPQHPDGSSIQMITVAAIGMLSACLGLLALILACWPRVLKETALRIVGLVGAGFFVAVAVLITMFLVSAGEPYLAIPLAAGQVLCAAFLYYCFAPDWARFGISPAVWSSLGKSWCHLLASFLGSATVSSFLSSAVEWGMSWLLGSAQGTRIAIPVASALCVLGLGCGTIALARTAVAKGSKIARLGSLSAAFSVVLAAGVVYGVFVSMGVSMSIRAHAGNH